MALCGTITSLMLQLKPYSSVSPSGGVRTALHAGEASLKC